MSHAALAVVVVLGALSVGLSSRGRGEHAFVAALVIAALAVTAHVMELLLA